MSLKRRHSLFATSEDQGVWEANKAEIGKTLAAPFISSIDSLRNDDGYGNENVTKK